MSYLGVEYGLGDLWRGFFGLDGGGVGLGSGFCVGGGAAFGLQGATSMGEEGVGL